MKSITVPKFIGCYSKAGDNIRLPYGCHHLCQTGIDEMNISRVHIYLKDFPGESIPSISLVKNFNALLLYKWCNG